MPHIAAKPRRCSSAGAAYALSPISSPALCCRDVLARLQAVCAGHVAAAQLAAAAAVESYAQPDRADQFDESAMATAVSLAASLLPEAVQPALLAPLETLFSRNRQVGKGGGQFLEWLMLWLQAGAWKELDRSSLLYCCHALAACVVLVLYASTLCDVCMRTVAVQGLKGKLERATYLCAVLDHPSAHMAAVLGGSSIPGAALQLAARLGRAGNPEAARQVGEAGLLAWR